MTSPTYIQLKYFMYPCGNTPAVNLLRNFPASTGNEETVRVLCLACGDPRSILFTLWSESGQDDTVWNLFYHMLIPTNDLNILRKHTAKLLEASESLDKWNALPYGKFVQFTTKATLTELRGYWTRYGAVDVSGKTDTDVRDGMANRSREIGTLDFLHGLRSAGPLWMTGMQVVSHAYRKYWETGIAGGYSEGCKALGQKEKGVVNPMFAISSAPSGRFAVHYGTDPLLGFHLAETFRLFQHAGKLSLQEHSDRLVRAAKTQFREWCKNLAQMVADQRVHIQFFSGEAVALCQELQFGTPCHGQLEHARTYSRPWKLQPLLLDGCTGHHELRRSYYDCFDVIDTSNLGDHIGLINVVMATVPVLRYSSASILYTESLLAASSNVLTSLSAALGSDVATFSLLVGLVPAGLISGTTLEAVSTEAGIQSLTGANATLAFQKQYRLRVLWTSPDARLKPTARDTDTKDHRFFRTRTDPNELAAWLVSVYKKMFAHEDLSNLFSRMQRQQKEQYSIDMQRYTRAAIVALIRVVMLRVSTDWHCMMAAFQKMVESDRSLLVGSNSLQELNLHMTLSGTWTIPVLADGPRQVQQKFGLVLRAAKEDKGLLGEANVPPIVHIILSVPREKLEVFTDKEMKGTPGMHLSVKQQLGMQQYDNYFYSFYCYFGTFTFNGNDDDEISVKEDDKGWQGSADLVVICAVPTFGLLTGPRNGLKVALVLNTSPEILMLFSSQLGPHLTVYETAFNNGRVSICRDPPSLDTKYRTLIHQEWLQARSHPADEKGMATASIGSDYRLRSLQIRAIFSPETEESKALANSAAVTLEPVGLSTINLMIGKKTSRELVFPFPIQSANSKTRVARKSSYVEVEVAPYVAPLKDSFDSWARMHPTTNGSCHLTFLPRVSLDLEPTIPVMTEKDSTWLNLLMGGMLSHTERQIKDRGGELENNPKSELKESLNIIVQSFAGFHPQAKGPVRTFQLTMSRNKSCHTLLFVHKMCHDLDLGSVVLDAYVLPLTLKRVKTLSTALHHLQVAKSKPIGVYLSDGESTLWKRLLPTLAERCRIGWNHSEKCEYRARGAIPLSVEEAENPLCSCGEGKVPPDFAKTIKEWAPFSKYVTRIAISPIFPVPYVEPTELDFSTTGDEAQTTSARCDKCNSGSNQLKACGGCGKVRYCSRDCQKAAWKTHKAQCAK
ncbi:MAG: hypothetical protein Q9220_001472 [cf. Caloplaca sp. 1 TL-2023]